MSDSPVVVTWNATNWITVLLMVVIGLAVIRLVWKMVGKKQPAD